MKNFKLGLRGHDIADSFDTMCGLANQYHIQKLQFALAKTLSDVDFNTVGYDEALADRVAQKLTEHKLSVSVLGCYINPVEKEKELQKRQLTLFKSFIRYAKKLQAGGIGTETGSAGNLSYTHAEENYQNLLKNMLPLIQFAEELDVNVYIEPVSIFTIHSPQSMRRMIDDVQSEKLNVILDISNMMTDENIQEQKRWINESFDLLGDRIKVVHLKDFKIEATNKKTVMLGTGQLEIPLLLNLIKELATAPDIILDETPLENYVASCNTFKEICEKL